MKRKVCLSLYVILLFLAMTSFLLEPCFFIYGGGAYVAAIPAVKDVPFSIRFIHSVQKTPVLENLMARKNGNDIELISTKYQSFGVGLPFLEAEGDFREEGNYYVFDNMNRRFPRLSLRTGVGTELTVYAGGCEYRLYEKFPPGTRIDLFIAPFYESLYR